VFLWSGGAKLARPRRAGEALRSFGLMRRASPAAGAASGVYELTLGLLLVAAIASDSLPMLAGAMVSATLLALAILELRSLRAGERFACFCFGDGTTTLSWWTLARTLALAVPAATLLAVSPQLAGQGAEERLLEAAVAAALVGGTALLGTWPRLRDWGKDPFGLGDDRWVRRATS
jgi:hypothetical protein